jgi:hypothetical protein
MPTAPQVPAAPVAPAPPSPTAPAVTLAGRWSGSGSDAQGRELLSWVLTQTGAALSGTADMKPLDAADGSCASCHKVKSGTVSGSVSGSTLAMKIMFPAGGDGVPTPMCTIAFELTAAGVSGDRIDASYAGSDSCEGSFAGGTLTMNRER